MADAATAAAEAHGGSADGKTATIVMAGRRENSIDPLAAAHGLGDKCLVPVAGRPMIAHVLGTLARSPRIGRIVVSVNRPELLHDVHEVRDLTAQGRLTLVPAETNLVESLLRALDVAGFPALVTTADHVLLTPDAIAAFLDGTVRERADVGVAFARREAVLSAHPEGQRRFYTFRDGSYSNCNTYWIGRKEALAAAEVFRHGGQFAKHPGRIVKAFGLLNMLRLRYGIGTLDGAFRRLSKRFGAAVRPIVLADGAMAIDVDNERTLGVAETIFAERAVA